MRLRISLAVLALAAALAPPAGAQAPAKTLLPAEVVDPARLLPPPPVDGSARQLQELAEVKRIVAERTPERFARAQWDDVHENVSLFGEVLGPGFDIAKLPATRAVLDVVDAERRRAEGAKALFQRQRPWAFDPSIKSCDDGQNKNPRSSYPSGHSLTGYSLGLALASLMPEKAQAIQARADDYAYSRRVCASHYASDIEASHVLATAVVTALFLDPALQARIAAARAELRQAGLTKG